MTKKQLAAIQRILAREAAEFQVRPDRPFPGQHPSENKYAVTDGIICVLMDSPVSALPLGEQADTFARIVRNERKSEAHFPVPVNQIDISRWKAQAKKQRSQTQRIELSAPILLPEQLRVDDLDAPTVVEGHFDPQLLVDAAEAVGGDPLFFLGYGRFKRHFPSLLVMPPMWLDKSVAESMTQDPIALVLSLRQ